MELCFDVMFALTWVMKLWHRPYQMFMCSCGPHLVVGHRCPIPDLVNVRYDIAYLAIDYFA